MPKKRELKEGELGVITKHIRTHCDVSECGMFLPVRDACAFYDKELTKVKYCDYHNINEVEINTEMHKAVIRVADKLRVHPKTVKAFYKTKVTKIGKYSVLL